jgi:hypothetical protein
MILKPSLAVAAFGLLLAGSAHAAPLPVVPALGDAAAAPVQSVQYWGGYDDDEYYARPPRRYRSYRADRPVRRAYGPPYGRPAYGYYYGGPRYYNREEAKDYVKDYRRAQKDVWKGQVRGWNRAHGF